MERITVVKIGGNVIDNPAALKRFLKEFAALEGPKILVHGGGKLATRLAERLELEVRMVEGRRITDKGTLDVVTMVYVGKLVNGTPFTNAEGTPAEEKDVVMTLIPGFKEGLSQMKEGGKAVFVIPADKGYGENGAGPVPPESALIFEVTLKKVEKPGANKESNQAMPAGHPPMNGSRPKMAWPHS